MPLQSAKSYKLSKIYRSLKTLNGIFLHYLEFIIAFFSLVFHKMEISYLVEYGQQSPVWYLNQSPKNFRNYFKKWWPENKSPLFLHVNFRVRRFKKIFLPPTAQAMGFAHKDLLLTYIPKNDALLEYRTCPVFEIFVTRLQSIRKAYHILRETLNSNFIIHCFQRSKIIIL